MNRIKNAFENKKALIGFLTGGDPTPEFSAKNIEAILRGGVDLLEIGIPFSDPIADGPVIQNANKRALDHGTNVETIFRLVETVRAQFDRPIVLMTSVNPVLRYGYERFFCRMAETGADGAIVPDVPLEERDELAPFAERFNVALIGMVAPTTNPERIQKIASSSSGFVYVVSSNGVTGQRENLAPTLGKTIKEIRRATDLPAAVGFGIHTPEQVKEITQIADGAIVGSALVRLVEQYGPNAPAPLEKYVRSLKGEKG